MCEQPGTVSREHVAGAVMDQRAPDVHGGSLQRHDVLSLSHDAHLLTMRKDQVLGLDFDQVGAVVTLR